jgi:ABC-type sugar transport system ATPase subunit
VDRSESLEDRPASNDARPVLAVERVTKRFHGIAVLREVSLSFGRSEIRAICGENGAGKSTLVKILTGVHRIDEGEVFLDGRLCDIRYPQQAQELGIALVSQELSLAPNLSVLDNIWLGNREVPLFYRRQSLRERAQRALDQVGLHELSLDTLVEQLSIGQRQLVEIARMLTRNARILVLDEPTATLSDVEIERIFKALRSLRAEGKTIIYITHRLGEVFEICDSVSVLRNGVLVGTRRTQEIDRSELMAMMLGRSIGEMYPSWQDAAGAPMLAVSDLRVPGVVHGIDLVARGGAVTCIAGQVGSGANDVLRALAGLVVEATGRLSIEGNPLPLRSVPAARDAKVQFISEDRAGEGIFLHLDVSRNLVATQLELHSRLGFLNRKKLRATASRLAAAVGVDSERLRSRADELSGGNQQKLAFGRSIRSSEVGVLLMNEPTRGVDVGARAEIYRLIRTFCDRGCAVVLASSDIEEVLGMGDFIITMYRGRQVGHYGRAEADLHQVLGDITHPVAAA